MRTAAETRAAAWNALKQKQYWTFVVGDLVQTLLIWFASAGCVLVTLLAAAALWLGLFGFDSIDAFEEGKPFLDLVAESMDRMGPELFLVVLFVGLMIVANLLIIPLVYAAGFGGWGVIKMSDATVKGEIRFEDAFSGWGHGWRLAWVIVVRETYAFLWALLLIIPGVIKSFSYALSDFIAFEHPDWSATRCIDESRRLMRGNKWRLFCLEFSFIGWYLLMLLANYFFSGFATYFLMPYVYTARYVFYLELKDADRLNPQSLS